MPCSVWIADRVLLGGDAVGLTPVSNGPARSLGFSQSACRPCDPRAHQMARKASSGMPALRASPLACFRTVSVTGAFLAFRRAVQSAHVCSATSSGQATAGARLRALSSERSEEEILVSGVWRALPSDCVCNAFALRSHCVRFAGLLHRASALALALFCLSWKRAISSSARLLCQPSSSRWKNSVSTASTAASSSGLRAPHSLASCATSTGSGCSCR